VERINWLADISANGLRKSAGMMVNYLYRLRDIEENHEAFAGEGRIIASATVRSLARG
jgi:malonyl-CoA decarboxylase